MAAEIMMKFNPLVPLTVHWDDKLLSDFTRHKSVDWLPAVAATEYNNCMACNRDRAENALRLLSTPNLTTTTIFQVLNKSPSTD